MIGKENKVIRIDINNNPEVYKIIVDSLPYMPSKWTINANCIDNPSWEQYPNKTPKYFNFYINQKLFSFASCDYNTDYKHQHWQTLITINSPEIASHFMEKLYDIDLKMNRRKNNPPERI